MKISKKWLDEKYACMAVRDWFAAQAETDGVQVVKKLISEKRYDWSNWLIVRLMDRKQRLEYAIYAAEQVLDIFERKYPEDNRPRRAIEAAKQCLDNDSAKNRKSSDAAAAAAAADAYYYAANAAAADAAAADAAAYYYAAAYAKENMQKKILEHGVNMLEVAE